MLLFLKYSIARFRMVFLSFTKEIIFLQSTYTGLFKPEVRIKGFSNENLTDPILIKISATVF
jgi:hypothetical protein